MHDDDAMSLQLPTYLVQVAALALDRAMLLREE